MVTRASLDPEARVLYGESLAAPSGYVFDAAVATTYSLDFETALAAPVSLALFAAENRDEILGQPLALLEGADASPIASPSIATPGTSRRRLNPSRGSAACWRR